jgi:hypothetical protein
VPVVLYEEKVLEVEKPMVQVLREEYPKEYIKEKVVPI